MLNQLLNNSSAAQTLTFTGTLAIIGSALGLGLLVSLVYILTHKRESYSPSFTVSLIMLPTIIAMIILLVGNNVARAFSLAGAFSLIRFRSAPGDPKDIAYVFFTLGIGLACGMGYIGFALLFALILSTTMIILTKINFGSRKLGPMRLKIVLPEDMDYNGAFDQILNEFTLSYKLIRVKTSEFGSLFELTYDITINKNASTKLFIDKLRCKNGNLSIVLSLNEGAEVNTF